MSKTAESEELLAQLHAGVEKLTTGEDWRRMLDISSQLHAYSFGNVLLISGQRPDATMVAGYKRWQELGRQVRRGERSIRILAPVIVKREDDNGDVTRVVVGFRATGVFDVSQTDGPELPDTMPRLLDGEAPSGLWDALAAQVEARGFTLDRGPCGSANGLTDFGARSVRVRADVSTAQAAKTLAHELAHVLLHGPKEVRYFACRGRCEVEAESVAYVVAGWAGLPTDGYSFPYVAHWAEGDWKRVQETGTDVLQAVRSIIADAGAWGVAGASETQAA
jgi:DNA primase